MMMVPGSATRDEDKDRLDRLLVRRMLAEFDFLEVRLALSAAKVFPVGTRMEIVLRGEVTSVTVTNHFPPVVRVMVDVPGAASYPKHVPLASLLDAEKAVRELRWTQEDLSEGAE